MKKIYALLLGLLAFASLAVVPAAHAQYPVTSYSVRANTNAFVPISGGTEITDLKPTTIYWYYRVQPSEVSLPFNYRFCNLVSNKFKVCSDGTVICGGSAQWPDACLYNYGVYNGQSIYYSQFTYPQYGYGYYPNNAVYPFSSYTMADVSTTNYAYLVQGTAPNRKVTIQSTNIRPYYNNNNGCSFQVVLYETSATSAFISKVEINFGPLENTNSWGPYGFSTGIKDVGNCNGEISIAVANIPNGATPTYTTCGYYSSQMPPQINYTFDIRYDYNLAWISPNNYPANNQILLINTPFTPSARISNVGKKPFTAITLRLQITGDPANPYDQSVAIPAAGMPVPYDGLSSQISFPDYTPVNYGIYTMTYSVGSSTPTDQFTPDNTFTSTFIISPPNNIAAVKINSPGANVRTPVNIPTPIGAQFRNYGVNNQTGVPVAVYIQNPQGLVVYRDTQILNNWLSSQIRDTDFKDFTPTQNGVYTICAMGMLPSDQLRSDDTVCAKFTVAYEADVYAVSIFNPDDQEEKAEKKRFQVGAYFQSVGARDLFDVPVRVRILRCSDDALVFQADTIMPELNVDAGAVKMYFPSKQGIYDIANLAPGCYKVCAIARQIDDGDRTNDTTCTFFGIIPRLEGNIEVGVGRRFQTISAAIDSLRFRGVGGPKFGYLNLILTDAAYSENGTTTASSPSAALDFIGIPGAGPTTEMGTPSVFWINWIPKKGVSPVITITGSKQYAMNWGYNSSHYMRWDGNNLFNVTPDIALPEPVKRGITIINNSTFVGSSVFNMEFGRHHLVLKNLNIRNNGNITNANSIGIRIANIFNLQSFLTGVRDTVPINNITIENNLIENAGIGISDIGTIPLFDLNQAIFFDKRNFANRIVRNNIGSQAFPIGTIGVQVGNEDGLYLGHNEISSIQGFAGSTYGGGIAVNSGNSINLWIDANKIHNFRSSSAIITPNTLVGIDIQQAATIYTQGSGTGQKKSTLPVSTRNRITNNMIYDARVANLAPTTIRPIGISTNAASYFIDNDSIFNNSLSVNNAPAMIVLTREGRPFLWDNVIQNLNTSLGAALVYDLTVPRPMNSNVSSNYNNFDVRNAPNFAILREYDRATGTFIQNETVATLNEWRTRTQQDMASVTGDPMFRADSLHLPGATSYILSPASNSGAWLNTATQTQDFDGEDRRVANEFVDMGADEFEGFQYTNDLGVQVITKPSGITDATGAVSVTAENPLAIQALVKNMGSIKAFNRSVTSRVDVSTDNGLTWNFLGQSTKTNLNFDVNETKVIDFVGPNITNEAGKLYRVTVSVAPDQNNANNSLTKIFKLLVKRAAVLISYESSTAQGLKNKDSLALALGRLGVPYDSLNRTTFGVGAIDYTPWWTLIWSTGDQAVAYNGSLGVGAVSLKEEEEIINFLRAGQTYAKKSFIIAGENIAEYNDPTSPFRQLNNVITDQEFMATWMHTQFVGRYPGRNYPAALPTSYRGALQGVGSYFKFADSIQAISPDVIKVNPATATVGDNVSRVAYNYVIHPTTPLDSGAGTAWTGSTFNVVFYPFDWSDAFQTVGLRDGETFAANVSGTTRFLRGALDFLQTFRGTVLPVEFVDIKGAALKTGNEITWSVAAQKNVDHYEVEMLSGNDWNWVGQTKASSSQDYSYLHTASAAFEVGKSFTYRIVSVDLDGSRALSKTVSFGRTGEGVEFSLEQNFPNPVNPTTVFNFSLPENGTVSLRILDMTGKVISTPVNGTEYNAGTNSFKFDASNLASGTYVYELSFINANGEISKLSRKMTLSK